MLAWMQPAAGWNSGGAAIRDSGKRRRTAAGGATICCTCQRDMSRKEARWPLVLFLHGAGERGSDVEEVARRGPPGLVAGGKAFPFVLVSPQCELHQRWNPSVLLPLVDHVAQSYHIDPDRVYVTGYSMGGAGTWDLAVAAPERFAAIAPLARGGDESQAERLMDLPIWAFHGAVDEVVPLSDKPEDGQCGACRRRQREADRVPEPRP